jgi:tetratricopeptide (TPR) repeat protein
LINSWLSLGDLETPLKHYKQLVADSPYDPIPRIALGRIYGMVEDHDEAIQEFKEVLRLDPRSYTGLLNLCQQLYEKGKRLLTTDWAGAWAYFEECMRSFQDLITLDETRRSSSLTTAAEYYMNIAQESYFANPPLIGSMEERELDLWVQAIVSFKRASLLAPERNRPKIGYQEGLQYLEDNGNAAIFERAGRIFREMGAEAEAVTCLQHSIALQPDRAEPYYEMALLCLQLAAKDPAWLSQAQDLLKHAARLSPQNAAYIGTLRQVRRRLATSAQRKEEDSHEES